MTDTYRVSIGDTQQNVSIGVGNTVAVESLLAASDINGPVQVAATSTSLDTVTASGVSNISVASCHGIQLIPSLPSDNAENRTLLELSVTNNGTKANTYTLQLDGPDWMDVQPAELSLASGETAPVFLYAAPDFFGDGTYTAALVASGESAAKTLQMNVTARNGTVSVTVPGTQTPTGAIGAASSGIVAIIVTALVLLIGGYYFFRRENVVTPSSTELRDYNKPADDFLDQNANTVVKALRDDNLSDNFLEILREEEKQGKARDTVLNEIRKQLNE
jgi:hypothetical protein